MTWKQGSEASGQLSDLPRCKHPLDFAVHKLLVLLNDYHLQQLFAVFLAWRNISTAY